MTYTESTLHPAIEKRLRDVIRAIDAGDGGGVKFAHWLSCSETLAAGKCFVTGTRDDCASLWYAPNGNSLQGQNIRIGFSSAPLASRRYAELAESLEKHML